MTSVTALQGWAPTYSVYGDHLPVQSYRDLIAWRKSMDLARQVYRYTELFPRGETYGLIAQLRRAAVSIPSKIAEGHERLQRAITGSSWATRWVR